MPGVTGDGSNMREGRAGPRGPGGSLELSGVEGTPCFTSRVWGLGRSSIIPTRLNSQSVNETLHETLGKASSNNMFDALFIRRESVSILRPR